MASNKMVRFLPLMRSLRSGPLIGSESRRHYWPSKRDSLWDPFSEMSRTMDRMFREIDRLSPFSLRELNPRLWRTVPIETTRDGQRLYKIELDLPHFEPKDINVTIHDRNVTVKAKKETESDGCKQYREYSYQYTLPNEVNVELIRSLLTNEGLLTIEAPLPQLKEPEAQEIPIQKQIKDDKK